MVEAPVRAAAGGSGSSRVGAFGTTERQRPVRLQDVDARADERVSLCNGEVDRLLGGGIVPGSLVLIGGEPGIGKSTLSLQIPLHCPSLRTLYVTGEESARQLKMRANRLGGEPQHCSIYAETLLENILEEAQDLARHGVKEIIVIAQDITRYGTDLYGRRCLAELCRRLSEIDGIQWIRLHYTYPDQFDDELIDEIANNDKIVKYLDIPIQHINNGILKAMNRRGTGDDIRALFKTLRERIPGLVLRTSLIAGLPGEGEAEFEELCEFLREAKIERAGVFPFSPEEGTPAAAMEHVDFDEAQRRAELIMDIQAQVMDEFAASLIGRHLPVICLDYDEEQKMWVGRSCYDSPDIEGLVYVDGSGGEGNIVDVNISSVTDDGNLIGEEA